MVELVELVGPDLRSLVRAGFGFWASAMAFGPLATRRGVRADSCAKGKEVGDTGVPGQSVDGRLRGLACGKTERPRGPLVGGGDLVCFHRDVAKENFSSGAVVVAGGIVRVGEREEVVSVKFGTSLRFGEFDEVAE